MMRRGRFFLVLAGVGACASIAGAVLAACSSGASSASSSDAGACATGDAMTSTDGGVLTPCAWDQPVTQPSDTAASAARAACTYKAGALPLSTLGPTALPADIPIDNIVVLTMENHSFDSYLGHLNQYGNRSDIESADAGAWNPQADGGVVPWQHAAHECSADTDHEWPGTHQEVDNGKMDGFVVTNNGWTEPNPGADAAVPPQTAALYDGTRAMWFYDQTDLPFYYELANTYAVADHYHCALQGPTYPNRMYMLAATSFGITTSSFPDLSALPFPQYDTSILDELERRHVNWHLYGDGLTGAAILYTTGLVNRWGRSVVSGFAQFQADARAGNLPSVAFVDPNLSSELNGGAGTDEHPPGDIQSGEQFVAQVVQAVTTSPQWAHTALFITHDENGGFFDHVPPPPACVPDGTPPVDQNGKPAGFAFDQDGIRVLLIAVSPYAKKGYVGHHLYDHTSLTRFIEARFKLPALTARDANAEPPTDLFDFEGPPAFSSPPAVAIPTIDPTGLSYCETTFGK
jgi:phospholipase C